MEHYSPPEPSGAQNPHAELMSKMGQEARNRPNIDWQDKIHRGILRGLRNISETP